MSDACAILGALGGKLPRLEAINPSAERLVRLHRLRVETAIQRLLDAGHALADLAVEFDTYTNKPTIRSTIYPATRGTVDVSNGRPSFAVVETAVRETAGPTSRCTTCGRHLDGDEWVGKPCGWAACDGHFEANAQPVARG